MLFVIKHVTLVSSKENDNLAIISTLLADSASKLCSRYIVALPYYSYERVVASNCYTKCTGVSPYEIYAATRASETEKRRAPDVVRISRASRSPLASPGYIFCR